jgi:hypothetical protein
MPATAERLAPRLFHRESLRIGVIVALIVGATLLVAIVVNGRSFVFNSDAGLSLRVARDPFGDGASFIGTPADTGIAYRYGRILYPLLAWLLAGGRPGLVPWTLPLVYAASVGLLAAAACELCRRRGLPALRGLWVLAVPSFWVTLPIAFSDPLVVALLLVVYLLVASNRPAHAHAGAAALLLARETAAIGLVPLVWRAARERSWPEVAGWAAAGVPVALWFVWVRGRIGSWGFAAPAGRAAIAFPFAGFARVFGERGGLGGWDLAAVTLGAVTVTAAVVAARRTRWFPIAAAALLYAVLIVCLGRSAVRLPAQTIRLMLPAQVLTTLAFVAGRRPVPGELS